MQVQLKVTATTDGKFVGKVLVFDGETLALNGFVFQKHQVSDLGGGKWRIHNSHYSADLIEVEV
jgi:hypothetical protein